MELKNNSKHRPNNMIIDVAENEAKELIKTGEFIELVKENLIVKKEQVIPEKKEDLGKKRNIKII